jgi:hypothetical protein
MFLLNKIPIPDPGSRGQKGSGSRIRIRNTGKYLRENVIFIRLAGCIFGPF